MVGAVVRPVVCPVLIGRALQLAALDGLIRDTYSGQRHVVLLAGEAGIGKSRLAAEARSRFLAMANEQRVEAGDVRVLTGHCFESDRTLPYAPLLDMFRNLFDESPTRDLPQELSAAMRDLMPLLPELSDLLPAAAAAGERPVTLDPAQDKHRLFQALAQVLLRPTTPQAIVVEDLHWCDDNSFDFLLYLVRRAAAHPLLLLFTYRSDEVHPALRRFLASLDRERVAIELPLAGLALEEVDALIRTIFPQPQPVRADFLGALYSLTEGNPFFLEEVLKSLLESGDIFFEEGRWNRRPLVALAIPRSVQDAVQRRLEQVSQPARAVLTLVAVAGRRCEFALLRLVTGRSEADLLALLRELIDAQLLVEESDERFAFRHALSRHAIYSNLLAPERRALHATMAKAVEQLAGNQIDAHLSELAYHFYEARTWERALYYSELAGEQAQRLYAPNVAAEQFSRAIEAAEHLDQTPAWGLYRARGQAHELVGDFDAARSDYTRALELARGEGKQYNEWQSLFDLGFLWTGRDFEQARSYLESALGMAESMGDRAALAHSINRVGNWYANNERQQEGRRYHTQALALFEELGDLSGQATTLDLLGISSVMGGDLLASTAYYERAVWLFRELGDQQGLGSSLGPYSMRGASYMTPTLVSPAASAETCKRDGEEAVALMRQIGSRTGEAFALMYLALGLGSRGAFARAWTACSESIAIAGEIDHQLALAAAHFALGSLCLDLLMPDVARQHAETAVALSRDTGALFMVHATSALYARACIAQHDYAEAEAALDAVLDESAPVETVAQRLVAAARVEFALARGQAGRALALIDTLEATSARSGPQQVVPQLWYWRAQALSALDDSGAATALLEAAQDAAHAGEVLPLRWRVQADLGHHYHAGGQRSAAQACWDQARSLVHQLAEQAPSDEIKQVFLARAEMLLPAAPRLTRRQAAKQAMSGLTEREWEVALLIAQGKSNGEIAKTLVLSQRTVQVHITNIFGKLGFQSRARIAAWAVETVQGQAVQERAGH